MDMDPRLMNNDLGYVYKYMKAKNQTASGFENDLEMTLHALHERAEFEQQVENGRLNSIHLHAWYNKPHKLNVKPDDVFLFVHDNLSQLEELINELERERQRAERDFHRSKTTYYPEQERRQLLQILRNDMIKGNQCSQNEIRQLRNKLKDQELELKRMQDTINSLKDQTTQNTSDCGIEVTLNLCKKTDRTAIVESPIPDLVSDDEYFDRMLDEVQDNNWL
ncbi:unnamed protein product [Heligmosomoides polygyrus]|uniref:Coiled-coil domain-containing protein n=1 Tax=Heligmosomoides polygyrus TaxID=6339 RepID=A0A183F340_HELPZ|nr:unnamed protein product [Heligmosomoides polygyrus]